MSNRSKPSKSDGTNQNAQADILIKSGVEVLNALKHKAVQSNQRRSQDFKFSDLNGSELEQIPQGPIKDMLKIDIQKLIYQTRYSNLKLQVAFKAIKTLGWFVALIVVMPHVARVALQSVQIVDHNNDLSLLTVVTIALVIDLGNRNN